MRRAGFLLAYLAFPVSIVRRINMDIVTLLRIKERAEHTELMKLLEDKANEFHHFCPYSCQEYHYCEAMCQEECEFKEPC